MLLHIFFGNVVTQLNTINKCFQIISVIRRDIGIRPWIATWSGVFILAQNSSQYGENLVEFVGGILRKAIIRPGSMFGQSSWSGFTYVRRARLIWLFRCERVRARMVGGTHLPSEANYCTESLYKKFCVRSLINTEGAPYLVKISLYITWL